MFYLYAKAQDGRLIRAYNADGQHMCSSSYATAQALAAQESTAEYEIVVDQNPNLNNTRNGKPVRMCDNFMCCQPCSMLVCPHCCTVQKL